MSTTTNKKEAALAGRPAPVPAALDTCTPDDIRCRAYEIYQERSACGCESGDPVSDWLQAEMELDDASQNECATDHKQTPRRTSRRQAMQV